MPSSKTYVVEHLDPELGTWSALEYSTIAKECAESGASFCITSVSKNLIMPLVIQDLQNTIIIETRGIEELYENTKDRICLLDPAALTELSPDDESQFDVFLFGGILGSNILSLFVDSELTKVFFIFYFFLLLSFKKDMCTRRSYEGTDWSNGNRRRPPAW